VELAAAFTSMLKAIPKGVSIVLVMLTVLLLAAYFMLLEAASSEKA